MTNDMLIRRRTLIKALVALGLTGSTLAGVLQAATKKLITKPIPSSGEQLPVMGVGTARTFDAIDDDDLMKQLKVVMDTFFNQGGTLVDSSPMYGSAQEVIGKLLLQTGNKDKLFAATKVWIDGKQEGIEQMERSRQLWGIKKFDLMQIHNLRDWEYHLDTINAMKADGKLRYTGITTSHGRDHDELEAILKKHKFDFVQFTYNIANRTVENRLLPIAMDRGIAVLVNRPYQKGNLFRWVKGKPLPGWAKEIDVTSWGQFFLKYVVSHPGVTCAIPATTKVKHMLDNMSAQFGRLPDAKMRDEMVKYVRSIKS